MTPNGSEPQSLRERRFRELEHVFAAYARTWPVALKVQAPEGIEATTFANRVRKVASEFRHDKWPASFTQERFEQIWKETTVGTTPDGLVQIKHRGKAQLRPQEGIRLPGQALLTVKNLGKDPKETFMRLVHLHHEGVIEGTTHILGLPEELGVEWEAKIAAQTWDNRKWSIDFRRHPNESGWILS